MGEELQYAYAKYLERMLAKSDDLVDVDYTTVPEDMDITPAMQEWCDFV